MLISLHVINLYVKIYLLSLIVQIQQPPLESNFLNNIYICFRYLSFKQLLITPDVTKQLVMAISQIDYI